MAFPWAAALGVGASALSAFGGGDKGLSRRTIRRRTRQHKALQMPRMNELYGQSLAKRQEALGAIRSGREASLRETSRVMRTGQRQIAEGETRALGASRQGITDRGLAGTSVAESADRAVRAQTDRAMDDLFTNFAAFRTGIYSQYASAEAQALQDLGEFYEMRYAREVADYWDPILAGLTGLNIQTQYAPSGVDFSGIGDALGQLAGWAFGGGSSSGQPNLDLPAPSPNLDI